MPERGTKRGTRIRPQSITMRTPSMVRLVSAIEVASTTLRRPAGERRDGAVLLAGREVAVERRHDRRRRPRSRSRCLDAADLADARQEDQHAAALLGEARRIAERHGVLDAAGGLAAR